MNIANNDKKTDVSIVIACYNEGPHLEQNVREIITTMQQTVYRFELILVDDCSTDNTREIIAAMCSDDTTGDLSAVYHERNTGRGKTVTDGIYHARGTVVGFLDIDLEVHARYIPAMVGPILADAYDVVTAKRVYKIIFSPENMLRHILSAGYIRLVRFVLGIPYRDTETGYKFFNRKKILPVLDKTENCSWFWDTEIMTLSYMHKLRVKETECLFVRNEKKTSTLRVFRDSVDYFVELLKFKKRLLGSMRKNGEKI